MLPMRSPLVLGHTHMPNHRGKGHAPTTGWSPWVLCTWGATVQTVLPNGRYRQAHPCRRSVVGLGCVHPQTGVERGQTGMLLSSPLFTDRTLHGSTDAVPRLLPSTGDRLTGCPS